MWPSPRIKPSNLEGWKELCSPHHLTGQEGWLAPAFSKGTTPVPTKSVLENPSNSCLLSKLSCPTLRYPVNRRWPWHSLHRILLQQLHCFLDRAFQLRIVSFDHVGRSVLHFDIRRYTLVLYGPLAGEIIERQYGRGDATAIDCLGHAEGAHQTSPGPRSDHWPKLAKMKHIWQGVAAGPSR